MAQSGEKPYCYGKLDTVFPKGADGLRHSPESCLPCIYKTECLRQAMQGKKSVTVREEWVDRAYASGMIGFLDRWSRKKTLHNEGKQDTPGGHTDDTDQ
jgi:hypothetical protein